MTANSDWTYSKCSRNDLLHLVSEGLLQEKNVVQWRPSFHQPYPQESVDEIILFQHFFRKGIGPPHIRLLSWPSLFLWSSTLSPQPKLYSLEYHMSRCYFPPRINQNWYITPPLEYFLLSLYSVSDFDLMNLQEHTNLYRSSPPLPEIEHPDHLQPSAYQLHRINPPPIDPVTDEDNDTDDDVTLVDFLKKSSMSTAQACKVVNSYPATSRSQGSPPGSVRQLLLQPTMMNCQGECIS
jgi:hypothetical protein